MSNKIEIYVAMHKDGKRPIENDFYQYVQAGSSLNKKISNVLYDDVGENISEMNPYYCELTVQYWAWKNSTADIKGLCHYRRFFSRSYINQNSRFFLDKKLILNALNNYDIILPTPNYYDGQMVKDVYLAGECGKKSDLDILRNIILEEYPDYLSIYDTVMNSYKMSYCNMFIASRKIYDEYSQWLFDVLKKVEPYIDMSTREENQKRIYGYLSERLLNVWVKKNNLRVKYYPMIKLSDSNGYTYKFKCILDFLGVFRPLQILKDFVTIRINFENNNLD